MASSLGHICSVVQRRRLRQISQGRHDVGRLQIYPIGSSGMEIRQYGEESIDIKVQVLVHSDDHANDGGNRSNLPPISNNLISTRIRMVQWKGDGNGVMAFVVTEPCCLYLQGDKYVLRNPRRNHKSVKVPMQLCPSSSTAFTNSSHTCS